MVHTREMPDMIQLVLDEGGFQTRSIFAKSCIKLTIELSGEWMSIKGTNDRNRYCWMNEKTIGIYNYYSSLTVIPSVPRELSCKWPSPPSQE
jgi:hypothetical protein